jgi:nicotinate-nucleotide adenylyltransferase
VAEKRVSSRRRPSAWPCCAWPSPGLRGLQADDREVERAGPTYTVDTLAALRADYPGAELFLQIGADQALAFHGWRRARDIIDIATVSIAVRDDPAKAAGQFDPKNPLPGLGLGEHGVRLLGLPALPHSATDVRARVAAGRPIDHLVPAAVAGYIADHHLYTTA